jgi:hypothetical protein
VWRGSVATGYDNDLVYRDVLGLSADELTDLRERKVI